MSHCANYILQLSGETITASTRWGAHALPVDVFWGPDVAFDFVMSILDGDDSLPLYSEVMCEAAVFINYDTQKLLLFGGEDLRSDAMLQRIYLTLLRITWNGWEVEWAYRGLAQIAAEATIPVELNKRIDTIELYNELRRRIWEPPQQIRTLNTETGEWHVEEDEHAWWRPDITVSLTSYATRCFWPVVVTLRDENNMAQDYLMKAYTVDVIRQGERIIELARSFSTLPPSPAMQRANGGVWVDEQSRQIHYWIARVEPSWLAQELQKTWSGWQVSYQSDAMLGQFHLSGRDPTIISNSAQVERAYLVDTVFSDLASRAIDRLIGELEERALNRDVLFARGALRNPKPGLDDADKQRILTAVLKQLAETD